MRIVSDSFLINRNQKIGQFATIGSLVILAGGLFLSFQKTQILVSLSFMALLLGFILSQVGIYFGNKFGRRPRPDEQLDTCLKGLNDKYTLYHFVPPCPHYLVGPAGIWILLPFSQGGIISYSKKRWHQKGGNWYLKAFAQEGIARPDLDIEMNTEKFQKYFDKMRPGYTLPPIQTVLVFTNAKVVLDADESPTPAITANKLKDFLRKNEKASPLPAETVSEIIEVLPYL